METLLTTPVTDAQVVLGKYAGGLTFLAAAIVPAVCEGVLLDWLSKGVAGLDVGALASSALILVAISSLCLSVGLMASLLTKNQIVAAIVCFIACCVPFLLEYMFEAVPGASVRLVQYVSAESHVLDFGRGIIDSRALVLYVSLTGGVLFSAVRILELRRWR